MSEPSREYELAISFAGAQRDYAEEIVRGLQQYGVNPFYDFDETARLWGKNLAEELQRIYSSSKHVLMLVSKEYLDRVWCVHERRSAIQNMLANADRDIVLIIKIDDSWPPGVPTTTAYVNHRSAKEISLLVCQKMGIDTTTIKHSAMPPPHQASAVGYVSFDYSDHNGVFVIGKDPWRFDTKWSGANRNIITLYDDPPSIRGIAVAEGCQSFADVKDASLFNFSSRWRRLHSGQIAIFENQNGYFAAAKIRHVLSRSHSDLIDGLGFDFVIGRDGTPDLSKYGYY